MYIKGRFEQGTPVSDGLIIVGPNEVIGLAVADCVVTRNAAADISLNVGATKTVTISLCLGKLLQKAGLTQDILENFGGSATPGLAEQAGRYGTDYTGNPETVRTTNVKKGVKITGVKVASLITGAALLAHTCRVDKNVYANNVALATTVVLASAANGLPTAAQANPYVTTVSFGAGVDFNQDLTEYVFEIGAQTQGGGAYRLYRLEFLVTYNYN